MEPQTKRPARQLPNSTVEEAHEHLRQMDLRESPRLRAGQRCRVVIEKSLGTLPLSIRRGTRRLSRSAYATRFTGARGFP